RWAKYPSDRETQQTFRSLNPLLCSIQIFHFHARSAVRGYHPALLPISNPLNPLTPGGYPLKHKPDRTDRAKNASLLDVHPQIKYPWFPQMDSISPLTDVL